MRHSHSSKGTGESHYDARSSENTIRKLQSLFGFENIAILSNSVGLRSFDEIGSPSTEESSNAICNDPAQQLEEKMGIRILKHAYRKPAGIFLNQFTLDCPSDVISAKIVFKRSRCDRSI